jgi:hypothetical protein
MAVNYDGTKLAMGCQDEIKIFAISYSETGIPTLTLLHSIKPAMGANSAGLAFDRAGNVYLISNSSERLGVWALPKADNQYVTPAPSSQKITFNRTSINEAKNPADLINVYPNPAIDNIIIECTGTTLEKVALYDLKGRLIYSENGIANRINLSVSNLQSGVYILNVITTEGIVSKRIMKQ